jgi:hypothetical protein
VRRRLRGADYSRELRLAKWGSGVSLHGSNCEARMSALGQRRTLRVPKIAYSAMPILDTARRPLSRRGLSNLRLDPTVRYR